MAPAGEQAQERRLERIRLEIERGDVPVQMVDGRERQPSRPRDRLRGCNADEEGPDQARAGRHADQLDVLEAGACKAESLADHGRDELEMAARGDLGHDSAVPRMQIGLRGDDVREHAPVGGDERGGGLVARRFEAENHGASSGERSTERRLWPPSSDRHRMPRRAGAAEPAWAPVTSQPRPASTNDRADGT